MFVMITNFRSRLLLPNFLPQMNPLNQMSYLMSWKNPLKSWKKNRMNPMMTPILPRVYSVLTR